ncbi:type IV toxin-antitoxin system AbiEi family antitoxin [Marisediminicola senii]|uniref:type IV toxin-antitoxin system AbiEi family antitoxin n=1 Tax=Marisediminicola senii TaxID=2711233 RepID=UPI0013EA7966|nr:type IV toxin-antitoxin system AbiEi family antitoxin [Marisediminicola senii]
MSPTLRSVLTPTDLPLAELSAARLDGELFAVDECYGVVGEFETRSLRAMALSAGLPPRLIAEMMSAAWILGATDAPPETHQLCAESTARYRCLGVARLSVREVMLEPGDTETIGGLRVTTARRTVIDLARWSDSFGLRERDVVLALATVGRLSIPDVAAELTGRRHLPGKLRALDRLAAC